jgi:hypothetical protein
MAETRVEPAELRKVAKAIGSIMDDYDKVFRNLSTLDPNAGKFDVAEWLEDLFVDRRDAIVTHAKYLRMSFEEINLGLYKVADAFEGVDMSNADAVAAATGVAKTAVKDMGDAEFTPTKMKSKDDYDTGDDKNLGDKKTYSLEGGKLVADFDPKNIPGMSDALKVDDLGKDDKDKIDLGGGKTIKDASDGNGIDLTDKDNDDKGNDGKGNDGKGNDDNNDKPPPPTGKNFTPTEPDQTVYTKWDEKGGPPQRTYRSYIIDGEVQRDAKGRQIYWFNSVPYIYRPSRGNSFVRWTE